MRCKKENPQQLPQLSLTRQEYYKLLQQYSNLIQPLQDALMKLSQKLFRIPDNTFWKTFLSPPFYFKIGTN